MGPLDAPDPHWPVFEAQPGHIEIFFFSKHRYAFSQGAVRVRFGNVENGALLSQSKVHTSVAYKNNL